MKHIILSMFIWVLLVPVVYCQRGPRVISRTIIPAKETLERLDLKLDWLAKVPVSNQRDRLVAFQMIPMGGRHDILVQTRSGLVQLMDAETGDLKWRIPLGPPYTKVLEAGYNEKYFFITRKSTLYVLDRATGKHLFYRIDAESGLAVLGMPLTRPPSASPVADVAAFFVPSNNELYAYLLPELPDEYDLFPTSLKARSTQVSGNIKPLPFPKFLWTINLGTIDISKNPLLAGDQISVASSKGIFTSINKFKSKIDYRFTTFGPIDVEMGQHENIAYVGSEDSIIYAIDMFTGRIRWRFMAGAPISKQPQVTDSDVFVTAQRRGLYRVHRQNGALIWNNLDADRFLSVNKQFVYALDRRGFFLVIDYLKGRTLAKIDTSSLQFPVSQTQTDRIYLGNNDGTIICLRHRNYPQPFRPNTFDPYKMKEMKKEKK